MKKIQYVIMATGLVLSLSCGNQGSNQNQSSGVVFNPQTPQSQIVTADREAKIAEKRSQYKAYESYDDILANSYRFEGKIKLTSFIPADEHLSETEARLIDFKTVQMVTMNGIGGLGGNPRFIIAPLCTQLQKDVMSKAPLRYLVKYNITLYIADLVSGTVFGSYDMQRSGVGDSETRAFVNMYNDINPRDEGIQRFLEESQNKIISYFQVHAQEMIAEAKRYAGQGRYEEALAILNSIPVECAEQYEVATKLSDEVFTKYTNDNCSTLLAKMKSALGRPIDETGFNAEAMCYYSMITKGSCKAEADKFYDAYKQEVFTDQEKKRKYLIEDRKWDMEVEQQRFENQYRADELSYDHQYKMFKTEMSAKVQIAGNTCLLEKYKKDAYNNLSFINKIFNIGSAFEQSKCGQELDL